MPNYRLQLTARLFLAERPHLGAEHDPRGIGVGEFPLDPGMAGGENTLTVRDASERFPAGARQVPGAGAQHRVSGALRRRASRSTCRRDARAEERRERVEVDGGDGPCRCAVHVEPAHLRAERRSDEAMVAITVALSGRTRLAAWLGADL